ncbi:MAG: dTMP kinase [Pirellulaceae bacterium]|nr:dTMP kinase [Pirellulaceae bacterium]
MFFSFDGVDGAGKSTQIKLLCEWLRERGHAVVNCRDPGGTQLGERLREILLGHHDTPIHPRAEMLLYMASRAQLVEELIRPAIASGQVVVSDRFLLANVVYQAHGAGLDPDDVWRVGAVTVSGLMPRLVFLLDMPAEGSDGVARAGVPRARATGIPDRGCPFSPRSCRHRRRPRG